MDRRDFLKGAALVGVGAVAGFCVKPGCSHAQTGGCYDNELTGFQAGGFTVPAGQVWKLTGLVESDANVIVEGRLVLRAGDTLRFVNVNEAAFVGGGMDPVASDVGLWVMGAGVLDALGTPKTSWTRVMGGIAAGATSFELDADPVGWQVGDRLIVAPTQPTSVNQWWKAQDDVTIQAINGRVITVPALVNAHPSITLPDARVFTAEVLNLTRDCRIEGTPGGRTHIFLRSSVPQTIKHVEMAHLSPLREGVPNSQRPILGRWGLHFHHAQNGSQGSLIEGCTVHTFGGRAFVPHASHGITMRDCIAHDGTLEGFWWDRDVIEDHTTGLVYDRCVSSKMLNSPFELNGGGGNVAQNCVAFGSTYNSSSGGFLWPSNSAQGGPNDMDTIRCLAHNNNGQGFRTWQNDGSKHSDTEVLDCVSYRNLSGGVAGSYANEMRWTRFVSSENSKPFGLRAIGPAFTDCTFNEPGLAYAAETGKHSTVGEIQAVLTRCVFLGYTTAGIHFHADPSGHPEDMHLVDCTFSGNELWMEPDVPVDSAVRIVDATHGDITARRVDQPGTVVPEWNASVS